MCSRLLPLCCALILLAVPASAFAQATATPVPPSNPTRAACGLPDYGTIVESVTYTLIGNCTQRGYLEIKTAETPDIELTINGAGFTIENGISVDNVVSFLLVDDQGSETVYNTDTTASPNIKVVIKNVTFDGNGYWFREQKYQGESNGNVWFYRAGIGSWILAEGTLEMENVTFTEGNGKWLDIQGNATLKNVLFEDSKVWSYGISDTVKGALYVTKTGNVTLNNAVFRDIERSVISVEKGGRLSTTGCLSFIRNITHNVHHSGLNSGMGTWTDSSTGACNNDRKIGNNDQAVVGYSPKKLPCGLPEDAVIDEDTDYTLDEDCICLKKLTVATGVKVSINANGYRIQGCAGPQYYVGEGRTPFFASFVVGGNAHLTITDANIYGVHLYNYGGYLTVGNSMIAETSPTPLQNHGAALVYKTTFQDNQGYSNINWNRGSVYWATNIFRMGHAFFRDNVFRRNSRAKADLITKGGGTRITFCGDNVRDNAPPEGDVPVATPIWLPLLMAFDGGVFLNGCEPPDPTPPPGPGPGIGGGCRPGQTHLPPNKMLGAIGFICHVEESPAAAIEIWEVLPDSTGNFALSVAQSGIEGVAEGLVACSRNGRAAVRVGLTEPVRQRIAHSQLYRDPSIRGGRDILISLGPTTEGKVHHYVIDHVLDGDVLGTVDTFSNSAPCLESNAAPIYAAKPTPEPVQVYAAPVNPQAPRTDGSIVHVVGDGDTIWAIGVAYGVHPHDIIARNQLPERGSYIIPGQELLIRPAE